MSEAANPPAPSEPVETAKPARPPRRWRRRLLRIAVVLLGLAVVARIVVPFGVPWAVNRVAAIFDLTCTIEDFEISLFGGKVQVWGVEVAGRVEEGEEAPRPYLDVEFAEFDLDMIALFGLDLRVRRLEADGIDVFLERTAEGVVPILRHLPTAEGSAEEDETEEEAEIAAVNLTLPVIVDAMRAQHVRIHYLDEYVDPPIESWLESSIRISDLGREDRSARIEIHTHALDMLDSVTIEASARSFGRNAEITFELDVRGVNPTAVPGWFRQFGFEPRAQRISMTTRGSLQVTPHPTDDHAVVAELDFDPVRVVVDGVEHARVDDIRVSVPRVRLDSVHVALVAVDGVHARIRRSESGVLGLFGIDIGAAARTRPEPAPAATDSGSPEYLAQVAAAALMLDRILALDWRFDELRLTDASLVLRDAMTGQDVELLAREAEVRDIVFGAGAGDEPVLIEATAASPGVVGRVRVQGELWPMAEPRRANFRFEAEEITGDGLDPYLDLVGLATDLENAHASATARIEFGRTESGVELLVEASDIQLVDGAKTLAALGKFGLSGLRIETDPQRGRIDLVEIEGGRLPVRRDAEGALHALGLKTVRSKAITAEPAAVAEVPGTATTEPATTDTPAGSLPRLELGTLRWSGVELAWLDEAVGGGAALDSIGTDGELTDIGIGGPPDADAVLEGRIRASLRPGDFADELVVEGTITTRPGPVDVRLELGVTGETISWEPFAPYLMAFGLISTLDDGDLQGSVSAALRIDGGVAAIEAQLSDFELVGGGTSLASLGTIDVDGIEISSTGLRIASVTIDRPSIRIGHTADEQYGVLGLLFDPASRPAPPGDAEVAPPLASATALPRVAIDLLQVRGATVALHDDALETPVVSALVLDATLRGVSTVPGDGAATIEAVARGEGFLDEATFTGRIELLEDAIEADGQVVASGLRAGPLAGYLPDGVTIAVEDGRATFQAEVRVAEAEEGGLTVEANLGRIELRDADEVLAGVERVRLSAPRLDPAGGVFTIAAVRVAGAEMTLARTGMAAFRIAGIELDLEALAAAVSEEVVEAEQPEATEAVVSAPGQATRPMPTVVLESLDLELSRLGYIDLSGDAPSLPIEIQGRVSIPGRTVLLDADPEALEPWQFVLDARIDPLVDAVRADVRIAPWRADAELLATLEVTGIHADALRELAPELGELLLGSNLDDGTFGATLEAVVRTRRKTPLDIDLARGFGAEVEVRDVALRATPDGEVLLGVDAIRIDARQIHPEAGMHFTSIEVENPRGRVLRDAEGLHIAGLILPDPLAAMLGDAEPAAETEPATDTETETEEPAEETAPVAEVPAEPRHPPFEGMPHLRIDQLLVQGVDFEFRDVVSDPPFTVPITGLDVEVARFSTRAVDEGRPVKFTAIVQGGEVELPKRYESASLLSGIVDSTTALVAGEGDEVDTEMRPLLAEAAVHGRLSVYPELDGQVRASLESLELTSFRGIARQMGIDIGDGVLDAGVELRFEGERGVRTRAEFTFGNLVVDEEPGGPISTYLKLPAPLQTVVFIMKDSAGEISVPIDVQIEGAGVTTGQIVGAAASAAGSVIATAVAESPLRLVGGVGGLFGIGGGEAEPPSANARSIRFAAADAGVPLAAVDALREVVAVVADDEELVLELRHHFGAADLARADLLANPDPGQALALVARLRQQRDQLIRQRAELTAETRVAFAIGRNEAAEANRRELHALLRELGETEDALDRMLEFSRPGADRRHERRARGAAIGIARQRLESVRLALLEVAGPELAARIEVRRPSLAAPIEADAGAVVVTPKERKQH